MSKLIEHKFFPSNKVLLTLIGLFLFALAFYTKYIVADFRTIALDEPFSLNHARKSLKYIFSLPFHYDPHPPLYYLTLHYWLKIVGFESIVNLKMLSMLTHSINALVIYYIGRKHFNWQAGLAASLLFIFSDVQFFFALDLRAYELKTLFALLSSYYCIEYYKNAKSKDAIYWGVFSALMVYTHYFGFFLILFQGILQLFQSKTRKKLYIYVLTLGGLFSPMVVTFINQFLNDKGGGWMVSPLFQDLWSKLRYSINSDILLWMILILFILGLAYHYLYRYAISYSKGQSFIYFGFFALVYLFMFFFSSWVPVFNARYTIFVIPLLFLGVTGTIVKLLPSKIAFVGLAILVGVQMFNSNGKRTSLYYRNLDSAVERLIQINPNVTSNVILTPQWILHGFLFHLDRDGFIKADSHQKYLESEYPVKALTGIDEIIQYMKDHPKDQYQIFADEFNHNRAEKLSIAIVDLGYTIESMNYYAECTFVFDVKRKKALIEN